MPGHDIIVIGASAGGLEAISLIVRQLPKDLPAAVFVCLHVPAHGLSVLPDILNRKGKLTAAHPQDYEEIRPGCIYVAPPDRHLLIRDGRLRITRGPKENGARPAIDPLFRSAARYCRNRTVAVVLSGTLDDGTAGLSVVKQFGGIAIVQDPDDALFAGMPRSALENVAVDYVLPADQIAEKLIALAHEPVTGEMDPAEMPEEEDYVLEVAERDTEGYQMPLPAGTPSPFSCPECHGVLWEVQEGDVVRFRCRTGHAFSADSLVAEQTGALEAALWTALRALEEKRDLALRLADRARHRGHTRALKQFEEQAVESDEQAAVILQVLQKAHRTKIVEPDAGASVTPRTQR